MSTMNAWEGWYDGPSSSDDDSLFTPVKLKKRGRMTVPMTVQELHEETVRRGEEYRWRKLARRKKREEARRKEEEPLPGKYFSENEEEAEFTDDDDFVCLDRDLSMEQRGLSPAPSSGDEFEFEFPAETDFKLTEKKGRPTKKHFSRLTKKKGRLAQKHFSDDESDDEDRPILSLKMPPQKVPAAKSQTAARAALPKKRRVTAEFPPPAAKRPVEESDSSSSDSDTSLSDLTGIVEFHQSERVNCFYCLEFFCASSFHWVNRRDVLAECTRSALADKDDGESNQDVQDRVRANFVKRYEPRPGCKMTHHTQHYKHISQVPLCVDAKLQCRFPTTCSHCSATPCVFHKLHPDLVATSVVMLRDGLSEKRVRTYVYGAFSEILKLPISELPACLALHAMRYYAKGK